MAVQTVSIETDSAYDWYTAYNVVAAFVGDTTSLVSGITDNIGDDTIANALNYIYSLAIASESTFTDPATFQDTLTVQGAGLFEANLTVNGQFTFNDTGSAAVTTILDEDNMASNSATALVTQQSLVAYIASIAASIDAVTLDGIDSASFLRSDADDSVNNDIHLQFGDGTLGSVRLEHNSTDNKFAITPFDGTTFDATSNLEFDGDNDYWSFAGEMRVAGAFTSLGIDDNGTSNKIQIENSAITLKTATTVQGVLTTTGNIIVPQSATTVITNNADEFITFDSVANDIDITAAATLAAKFTGTGASTLYYNGSAKLATSSTGATVTGGIVIQDASSTDITNNGGETVRFKNTNIVEIYAGSNLGVNVTANGVGLNYAGSTKLATVTGGVVITGALSASGDVTGNTSDARLKTIVYDKAFENPLDTLCKLDGVAYQWNKESLKLDPNQDLETVRAGVIAQDIEKYFPLALGDDLEGYKTVKYSALIPLIIEAIKELNLKVK